MFELKEEFSLKNCNSFGIDVKSSYYVECSTIDELIIFLDSFKEKQSQLLILGGGSNILFTGDFKGYVLKPNMKGIELIEESDDYVNVKVGAGEDWDEFVEYCVNKNWGGIENLSLIPGNVGACPIQNIGAYGVEVKDVLLEVETINLDTLGKQVFKNTDCKFGYRNSIFKNELKGKYIITHVTFQLEKKASFKLDYGNLKNEIEKHGDINLKNIRQTVIDIRNSKLPKVEEIGNAGSFFKNPVVNKEKADNLKNKFPEIPLYDQGDRYIKVPAGWLIEKAGWKGKRKGDAGVHEKQALVLVNYGGATGNDILHLARNILQSIIILFDLELEMEVNIV